jgi:hypothetical protein
VENKANDKKREEEINIIAKQVAEVKRIANDIEAEKNAAV